jgi:hypothetical protein
VAALDRTALHVVGLVLAVVVGMIGTLAAQQTMGTSWRSATISRKPRSWSPTAPSRSSATHLHHDDHCGSRAGLPGSECGHPAWSRRDRDPAVEEPYLMDMHGQTYRDYACRVGASCPALAVSTLASSGADRPRRTHYPSCPSTAPHRTFSCSQLPAAGALWHPGGRGQHNADRRTAPLYKCWAHQPFDTAGHVNRPG